MEKLYQPLMTAPIWFQCIIYPLVAISIILLTLIVTNKFKDKGYLLELLFTIDLIIEALLVLGLVIYSLALAPQLRPYTVTKQNNHIILKSNSAFLESAKLSIEKELKDGYLVEYKSNYYKINKTDITD
jgi:hypothetical protein